MSIQIDKIANDLFEKIRSRFEDISLGDEKAKSTQKPENARFFNFDYIADGENFGNVTISLIDELSLKIYFSKNISENLNEHQRKHWYDFLKELRYFAKRSSLNFEPRDITRNTLKHRDIQQLSKDDDTYSRDDIALGESLHKAYTMTKQNKFAKQFEQWANQITESAWSDDSYEQHDDEKVEDLISLLASPLEVGVDAINAINALVGIITSDELSDELLALANEDPSEDARYVILDWLECNQPELYQMVLDDVSEPSEEAPEEELEEVDEGKGLIRKAAAGAALIGALGAGSHAMDQSSYSSSPQLQKLEQLHQQAVKSGDSARADSLANRIENHKARLSMGKGEVRTASGAPKEVNESLSDIRKLAGLLNG